MKKTMLAASLICGVFLMAQSAFAYDYLWNGAAHTNSLVTKSKLNVDAYLPWSSGGSAKAMGMGGAFTAVANDLGGAVEYNPAGLTQLEHVNISALAISRRSTGLNAAGKKTSEWDSVLTQAGAAIRLGPLAFAVSRKQPENASTYMTFGRAQHNIYAPDGWTMGYTTYGDMLDTDKLKTTVLTGAIKLGKLSLGANYNSIKGDITRLQYGVNANNPGAANNYFHGLEKVTFDGYTMDAGALMNMGAFRLGAAAKNFKGSVDLKRNIVWQDNFDVGGGNPWNWVSPTMSETVTKFAPTTTVGAALILGKVFTVGADYVSIKLVDSKKTQARLGAELAVVPGFLFARGGVKRDLKNKIDNQDNKVDEYFIGAGLKMLVLTVDASASLASAKAGSSGDNMTAGVSATLKF